jgi:hypothetical protein
MSFLKIKQNTDVHSGANMLFHLPLTQGWWAQLKNLH